MHSWALALYRYRKSSSRFPRAPARALATQETCLNNVLFVRDPVAVSFLGLLKHQICLIRRLTVNPQSSHIARSDRPVDPAQAIAQDLPSPLLKLYCALCDPSSPAPWWISAFDMTISWQKRWGYSYVSLWVAPLQICPILPMSTRLALSRGTLGFRFSNDGAIKNAALTVKE